MFSKCNKVITRLLGAFHLLQYLKSALDEYEKKMEACEKLEQNARP